MTLEVGNLAAIALVTGRSHTGVRHAFERAIKKN